jgi:hypothetical protein
MRTKKAYFRFKSLFWPYLYCFVPMAILAGGLALVHISPIYFNGTPRFGFDGLMVALLYSPFLTLIISGASWLSLNIGCLLYNIVYQFLGKKDGDK